MSGERTALTADPSIYMVGSFPPSLSNEEIAAMPAEERDRRILEHTLRRVFSTAGPYLGAMSDSESTPGQVDWEIDFAKNVLPKQEGVAVFPGPHAARSLLSSPHFGLKKGYDKLPVNEDDVGMRLHYFATRGIQPFETVSAEYGRSDMLCKLDVPVGMDMVYFGGYSLVRGMRQAIHNRDGLSFSHTFWGAMEEFETKFREPMEQATRNQINKVLRDPNLAGKVELQLSAPAPFGLASLLYLGNQKRLISDSFLDNASDYLAGRVSRILNYVPENVPTTVHQCKGEINPAAYMGSVFHESKKHTWSNDVAVDFAHRVAAQTQTGKQPHTIHTVATPATAPVFTDTKTAREVLAPYKYWPEHIRLAAGMLSAKVTVEQGVVAYQTLRDVRGGAQADVAITCGAGRQREAVAGKAWKNAPMRGLRVQRDVVKQLREAS